MVVTKLSFLCLTMLFSAGPSPAYKSNIFFSHSFCFSMLLNGCNHWNGYITSTFSWQPQQLTKLSIYKKYYCRYALYILENLCIKFGAIQDTYGHHSSASKLNVSFSNNLMVGQPVFVLDYTKFDKQSILPIENIFVILLFFF